MQNTDKLIADLLELEPIKIWSLLVTLFGELDGDQLTGKQLRAMLEPLGIKPETIRVALYRLKNDGWIVSQKSGREVRYKLSKSGQRDTEAVYQDVYSQEVKYPDGWQLFILGERNSQDNNRLPLIQLGRNIALTPRMSQTPPSSFMEIRIVDDPVPDWFEERFLTACTLKRADQLAHLAFSYQGLDHQLSQFEKIAIRLLFLHHWRKMALRPACWAHIGLLPDGSISKCHKAVTHFLKHTEKIHLIES